MMMALMPTNENARKLVQSDLKLLAPKVQLNAALAFQECQANALDAIAYETLRSNELAMMYYALKVSRSPNGYRTWHFYGLAFDVISQSRGWDAWSDPSWAMPVVAIFKRHRFEWGGDWIHFKDEPHFQWYRCKPSPSDQAIQIYHTGGLPAVWAAVGAD